MQEAQGSLHAAFEGAIIASCSTGGRSRPDDTEDLPGLEFGDGAESGPGDPEEDQEDIHELLELLEDQVSEPDAADGQIAADDRLLADLPDSPGSDGPAADLLEDAGANEDLPPIRECWQRSRQRQWLRHLPWRSLAPGAASASP